MISIRFTYLFYLTKKHQTKFVQCKRNEVQMLLVRSSKKICHTNRIILVGLLLLKEDRRHQFASEVHCGHHKSSSESLH